MFNRVTKMGMLLDWRDASCHRHWDPSQRRHHVLAPQLGKVTVPQRNHRKANESVLPRRRTTGLFRSSQWGSATIPYKGAKVNVPVLSGNKKASFVPVSSSQRSPRSSCILKRLTRKNTPYSRPFTSLYYVMGCVRCFPAVLGPLVISYS
jgi:hypothetical protein